MSALPIVTGITPEEYLERERAAEFKSEYHDGRMYAMAGTTYRHGIIVNNLGGELRQALRKTPCTVSSSDLRVRISERQYTYPDIVVVCDPRFADDQKDTLLNPRLIIEVLSNSTEAYDRGYKAIQYRKLESLQEHVFVSQTEPRIEVYRRHPEGWILIDQTGLDSVCRLESLGYELRLSDIYEKAPFEELIPPSL